MSAPIDPAVLHGALADLGVFPADLEQLRRMPLEAGRQRLEALKEQVRHNFKKLALQLHPDVTGGDQAKEARFKLISRTKDDFLKLRLEPRPQPMMRPVARPMPNMTVMRVVTWTSAATAHHNATNSTTSTFVGIPFRVAVMRPT